MKIRSTLKGATLKSVTVDDITDQTDQQILDFAMEQAGETLDRLHDARVERYTLTPDVVNVFLYTS